LQSQVNSAAFLPRKAGKNLSKGGRVLSLAPGPLITNIQRFSVDDGPGIRTTVFFKGCNLRCRWCHNPECIDAGKSMQYIEPRCVACGKCAEICPVGAHKFTLGTHSFDRSACVFCGKCEGVCCGGALSLIGREYAPEDLVNVLMKDSRYYEAGGGVTFSGGEPMIFPDFLSETLRLCKLNSWHTAVDTAGNVPFSHFETVLPLVDLFLFDVKLANSAKHRSLTGVNNAVLLDNLRTLDGCGICLFIRVPVIPGVNDDWDELNKIAETINSLSPLLVQLLPYHSYGAGKADTLGLSGFLPALSPPSAERMREALRLFTERGMPAQIS
jgi:pyruvate formate lyase activating enzyme